MQLTVTFALSLVDSEILHTPVLFRLKFRGGCCRSMMLGCAKSEDPRLIAAKLYYENSNLCDRCWFSLGCGLWWRFISQPVRPIRSIWHCYHAVCYGVPQGSVLGPVPCSSLPPIRRWHSFVLTLVIRQLQGDFHTFDVVYQYRRRWSLGVLKQTEV